jgi:hypothetical protein
MKKYFLFVISTFVMGLGILSATGCDSDATITPQTRNAYSKVNLSDWQMQKCDYLEGMACPFQLLKREYEGETYYWYSSPVFSNIFEHLYDSKGNHWKDVNNVEPPYTEFTRYEDGKWLGWEVIYEYWP